MSLLLTIGPEYRGGMFLYHNAEKSADLFESIIVSKIKKESLEIIRLRGTECSANNIINTITSISDRKNIKRIYIYYSGHGDHHGNKEFWQTNSGNIDQIKIAELINILNPLVIVISDCCSSEHLVNSNFVKHSYISLGATLDNQDAMMTGEGGLFTLKIFEIINELDINFTFKELFDKITENRIEVETFSIKFSSDQILDEKFFI